MCGPRSTDIQKKLLTERELTLQRAYEIAAGMEAAETQATVLKPATEVTSKLQKLHLNEKKRDGPECFRCGKTGHSPDL